MPLAWGFEVLVLLEVLLYREYEGEGVAWVWENTGRLLGSFFLPNIGVL